MALVNKFNKPLFWDCFQSIKKSSIVEIQYIIFFHYSPNN